MTSKMRADNTCRTDVHGPSCRRGESRSTWRVTRFTVVAVMAMVLGSVGFVSSAAAAWNSTAGLWEIDPNGTYIETENYNTKITVGNPALNVVADAAANSGSAVETTGGGTLGAPAGDRLDYDVYFPAGTYYYYFRLQNSGTGDSAFLGIDGTMIGSLTQTLDGAYYWTHQIQAGANSFAIAASGVYTINVWGRENVFNDGFYLTSSAATPPGFSGTGPGDYTGTIPTGATVLDPTAPGCAASAPSDLSGSDAAGAPVEVDLSWTADCTNNDTYTVYRDGVALVAGTNIACSAGTMTYNDAFVTPLTAYAYTVRGYNSTDTCESADSNTVNVTTNACSETTPSIVWTAQSTASGDFSGSPFVTLTNVTGGSMEYQVTEVSGPGTPFTTQTDDFAGLTNGDGPTFGNWTAVNGDDGAICWDANSGGTPSNTTTGPSAGNPDPYIYCESSTAFAGITGGSNNFIESNVIDASSYAFSFNFDWNMYVGDNGDAELHVEGWNGSAWIAPTGGSLLNTGDNGDVWINETKDFSSFTNADFQIRFRFVAGTGTIFLNDVAVDNLEISGTSRSVETTIIPWTADPIPGMANLTDGNTYNLYARGLSGTCGVSVYGDDTASNLTPDGTSTTFDWTACTESTASSVTIDSPTTGQSLNGTVGITTTLVDADTSATVPISPEYSVDGGSTWTYGGTAWDTTTVAGSDTAAVAVTIDVRAIETECKGFIYDTVDVTVDNRVVTAAGTATAVASGPNSVSVSMPYGADVNNTSTYDVDFKLCADGGYTVWTSGAANTPSPYTDSITGLTADECYDVRMTYLDLTDSVSGTAVQTITGIYLPSNKTRIDVAATATASNATTIAVNAPYTADQNNNNTLLIEWDLQGDGYGNSLSAGHASSPYTQDITGLTESTAYEVRVTYADVDGIVGSQTAVQTFVVNTPSSYTPSGMLHNSDTLTDSTYWNDTGVTGNDNPGWGVPGGQYGAFTCNTCHVKGSSNIKRIRTSIPSIIGPAVNKPVNFQATVGSDSFGDDDRDGDGGATVMPTTSNLICEVCHSQTEFHRYDMTGQAEHNHAGANQTDCIQCHPHNQGFKGAGGCTICHGEGSSDPNAPQIVNTTGAALNGSAFGTHLRVASYNEDLSAITDWDAQCKSCHGFHTGDSGLIPNNPAVGINYTSHGGIYIGGTATTMTTEAEICWECHDAIDADGVTAGLQPISEWGVNSDTNGTESDYDFGSLNQSNWVGAQWTSAVGIFSYKTANIQSTHAVSGSATAPGMDPVEDIRCSYCHDVHGTANYTGVIAAADDPDGKPYLRGNWMGNPYREDGAPQSTVTYVNLAQFGAVPRGDTAQTTVMGGYWIDQNSGDPTTGWTADGSSGLCELCHGDGDGTWSAGEINGLNEFNVNESAVAETPSDSWVGTNGHAAVALGGDGTGAANIFDARGSTQQTSGFVYGENSPMAYQTTANYGVGPADGDTAGCIPGARMGSQGDSHGDCGWNHSGEGLDPHVYQADTQETDRIATYEWGATVTDVTKIDVGYHKFSCSKCHNPHASRLPRLMITNCLDTKHNTWDNASGNIPTWAGPGNDGRTLSNSTTAQNCHRLAGNDPTDADDSAGIGAGWNNVTPW